ncbi:WxL domain-containing protein [Lactiplantibacillus sp. WILCCON 0030]|uniref:WxL domain-containing protein n=1 Tax=Lactiplantibacillus brownii TaxID=3069269 RepID=A0ABU1AD02_9LACO|nr:WxL domain-containing protein [Lactiplantibacillus brownii]MDQ7938302.1 WxL domain-containing protein [Lactiplantibacillus brownii]
MKKVIGSLLMSGALLGTVVAPLVANADDTTAATENRAGSTEVTTTFTPSTKTVTPVDPDNPNKPIDPGDNNGAHAGGGLSLIYAPTSFDFGSHEIDVLNDKTYNLDTTSANTKLLQSNAVLEVSDVRGTNAGWTLTATAGTLTNVTDGTTTPKTLGTDTIKGAQISLPGGKVSNSGVTGTSNGATPTNSITTLNLDSKGSTQQLLGAKNGSGAGVTVDKLDPANITLSIPANTAKAETYSTNITWALSDTPAS